MDNWRYYSKNYYPLKDTVSSEELYQISLEEFGEFWLRMRIRGLMLGRTLIHHTKLTPNQRVYLYEERMGVGTFVRYDEDTDSVEVSLDKWQGRSAYVAPYMIYELPSGIE